MIDLAPLRTSENPVYQPGDLVTYAPAYLNGLSAPALVLGPVLNPPFADVPLYRVRVLEPLPGRTLPSYTTPPGKGTVYEPVAAGEEVPNALWHYLSPLKA